MVDQSQPTTIHRKNSMASRFWAYAQQMLVNLSEVQSRGTTIMLLKTPAQNLAEFDRSGTSVSGWATEHGIPRHVVNGLLHGRLLGRRGQAHDAAVLLGLKDGIVGAQTQVEEK
jgi:gp16 family phage-associated protein